MLQVLTETKRGDALLFETNAAKEEMHELNQQKQQLSTEKRDLAARVMELQEEQDGGSAGGSSLHQMMAASNSNSADTEKITRY
jgi:hypothetical protein